MIIEYYSAGPDKYLVKIDLSKEKILNWDIDTSDKYAGACLAIEFCTKYNGNHINGAGIHPPRSSILNYVDVLKWLEKNYPKINGTTQKQGFFKRLFSKT